MIENRFYQPAARWVTNGLATKTTYGPRPACRAHGRAVILKCEINKYKQGNNE